MPLPTFIKGALLPLVKSRRKRRAPGQKGLLRGAFSAAFVTSKAPQLRVFKGNQVAARLWSAFSSEHVARSATAALAALAAPLALGPGLLRADAPAGGALVSAAALAAGVRGSTDLHGVAAADAAEACARPAGPEDPSIASGPAGPSGAEHRSLSASATGAASGAAAGPAADAADGAAAGSAARGAAAAAAVKAYLAAPPTAFERALEALVIGGLGAVCRTFLFGLSTTTIHHSERLADALRSRPAGQGLVTVSNHVASIDDPLIVAAVVPPSQLMDSSSMRWTLCATDRCGFHKPLLAAFFKAGRVLPVDRGAGLGQAGMHLAVEKLDQGDWVHVFPEGTRSRDGRQGPVRRGVGWLVAGAAAPPLVVPFVHVGMEQVMPVGSKLPRPGQRVDVVVGDPIPVADLIAQHKASGRPDAALFGAIAARVAGSLAELRAEAAALRGEAYAPGPAEVAAAAALSAATAEGADDLFPPLMDGGEGAEAAARRPAAFGLHGFAAHWAVAAGAAASAAVGPAPARDAVPAAAADGERGRTRPGGWRGGVAARVGALAEWRRGLGLASPSARVAGPRMSGLFWPSAVGPA